MATYLGFTAMDCQVPKRASGGRISARQIDRAADAAHRTPTEAQKQAGNYRKGHVRIHGIDIAIETPRGSHRSGVDSDGKPWRVKMGAHYGYIKGTTGADGDHVDVYIGPHIRSPKAFVLDQHDADSGRFDEHKAFLGFASVAQVANIYGKSFSDGRAHERFGPLTEMTIPQFKDWLRDGDHTRAMKRAAGGRVPMASGGAVMSDADVGLSSPPPGFTIDQDLPDAPWVKAPAKGNRQLSDSDVGLPPGFTVDSPEQTARNELARRLRAGERDDPVAATAWRTNAGVPKAGATDAAIRGATLGWSDEISAAARAPIDMALRGESFGEAYEHNLASERERMKEYEREHPIASTASEVAGGFANVPAKAAQGVMMAARGIPKLIATGAGMGAAAGAGNAEDDRLQGAYEGAALGAGLSAAIPAAGAVARTVAAPFTRTVAAAINPEARAYSALARDMARDSVSVPEARLALQEAQAAGKPMALADVGDRNVMGLARAVATGKGEGSQALNSMLEGRRLDSPARVVDDLRTALADPDIFHPAIDALASRRQALATPLYDAAYARAIKPNKVIAEVIETPAGRRAVTAARELAENEGVTFNAQSVRGADYIKRAFDDMIDTARRTGANNEARIVGNMKDRLVRAVDLQAPEYKAARNLWSSHADMMDALETGRTLLRPGFDKEAAVKQIRGMSDGERQMARIGMARYIAGMFDQPNMTLSKINTLLNSDRMTAVARELFPTQAGYEQFRKGLQQEAAMLARGQRITGGSNTVNKLADVEDLENAAAAGHAITHAVAGNWLGSAMHAGRLASRLMSKGVNERVANRLGEMLSTADPAQQARILDRIEGMTPNGIMRLLGMEGGREAGAMRPRMREARP